MASVYEYIYSHIDEEFDEWFWEQQEECDADCAECFDCDPDCELFAA